MTGNTFFKCVKKYGILLILEIAMAVTLNYVIVRGNDIIGSVIDDMLSGADIVFTDFLVQFLVLTLAGFITAFIQRGAASGYSNLVCTKYREKVAEKIYRLEYIFFDSNTSAGVLNKVAGDLREIANFLESVLPEMVSNLIAVIIYAGYICYLNVGLFLLLAICYPLIFWISNLFVKRISKWNRLYRQKTDTMAEIAQDAVSGILVLRSFGLEEIFKSKMQRAAKELVENEQRRVQISNTSMLVRKLIQWMPNIICAVYAVFLVKKGQLSMGSLVAFILVLNKFIEAFVGLPFAFVDASTGMISVKRIEEILTSDEETGGEEKEIPDTDTVIVFDDICFGYQEGQEVLQRLSFQVKKGEKIAFVGESGTGKSTVFNLLCGFYHQKEGTYKLFGRDFKDWDLETARNQIALVSQNVFLFPGTIEENVAFGNKGADRDMIVKACKKAEIHDFIMSLPDGYETVVGERGAMLSGGQKQRISIARAILKNASILLLDEPTSAIDVGTEKLIKKAIDSISEGRTCITIAHRLSTVEDCDRIMVLKHGSIAEEGKHEELIRLNGIYASMYKEAGDE